MRRIVNGDESDLHRLQSVMHRSGDRWLVHTPEGTYSAVAIRHDSAIYVSFRGKQYVVEERRARTRVTAHAGSGELRAPMPGQIVDVRHSVGDSVRTGATILVLEAMKTQQPFAAPFDGVLVEVFVEKGDQVNDGAILAIVEAIEAQDVKQS
jgi:biotin carboxyl carrier protein